jgi:hypothetical protein
MNGDEVKRVERAMDRQADKIGAAINGLGEKISVIGERVTKCETKLEDHLEFTRPEPTNVGPAPQSNGDVRINVRLLILLIALALGGGGGAAKLLGMIAP